MADAPDLFLSHNSEDKPLVREVAAALRKKKLTPCTPEGLRRLVWGTTGKKPGSRKTKTTPDPPGPAPLHNLPFSPLGELFKGWDDELRELVESLQGDVKARAIVQEPRALYGLGGIGKTRLAVEYAWRFGARYRAALFVRAESPSILGTGLASLSILLGQPARQSQDETVQAVLLWLQTNPGWLLILDAVDSKEAERAVLEILPRLNGGHVLITSRLRNWPRTVSKQELDTVSLEEAQAFLLQRTDGDRRTAPDDEAQAMKLAAKLDGLPLALEQAGAYISSMRISFADYLKIWDEERIRGLEWHDETMGYPASVAATWKASFDRLQPTAAKLLRLMAFLAPEPIPEEMFDSEEEAVVIQEALAELESYSLISREDSACSVHQVVQEVVQRQIPREEKREWIEKVLGIVDDYSPAEPNDVRTWPVWNLLRPHAARIVSLADESGVTDPTSRLMVQLSLYLETRALYSEAEPLVRRALAIDEASFGNDHPEVAIDLNNLAQLLKATNRLSEAEPLMRRALAIDEASFGNEHPGVARDLNNLALLLKATNRLSEAEPLMRRALAIDEASFGNEHPKVAINLNNLALLLQDMNRLSEAEPLMRRAVEIKMRSFGPDHPSSQISQRNLELMKAEIAGPDPTPPPAAE